MQIPSNIAQYVQPWNRSLWYWEIAELKQFVANSGIDTANLHAEGLKQVVRFLRARPNMGHEEMHYFALQVQEQRACKWGAKFWHMQCTEHNKPQ